MFPTISHINDLLPYIEHNPQFRVAVQPNGFTVVCYMLQDEDTFRGEHEEYWKECRGITFNPLGYIASRTLHKFQNVGENEQTQANQIPWDRITRVMDKRDGSMITPVMMEDGSIVCKTKKTFTSNEAIEATKFLNADSEKLMWVRSILEYGHTPTFEWTSPRFPIVLTYDKDELTLLQIRHNESGEYLPVHVMRTYENFCPFPVVKNIINEFSWTMGGDGELPFTREVNYELFQKAQLEREGVEGWIVQTDEGEMWKIKTKWYCDLHHSVTFTRWRDVARTVLDDKSDDLKAAFAMTGRSIRPIEEVEKSIHEQIAFARDYVEEIVGFAREQPDNITAKDVALRYKDHRYFGQIMRVFRGLDVDWNAWYLKNHLKTDFGLEVIPTAVQNEDNEAPIEVELKDL